MATDDNHPSGLWREHFHWSVLLRWDVLGWILAFLLAVGGLLLFFDQYWWADVCLMGTALFVFAKIAQVAIVANDPWWQRMLFTFLLFGLTGVVIVESVRGVNHWAESKRSDRPPAQKTPPNSEPAAEKKPEDEPPPTAQVDHTPPKPEITHPVSIPASLQSVFVQSKTICQPKQGAELPGPEVPFTLLSGDAGAYLSGGGQFLTLKPVSPIRHWVQDDNSIAVIERFGLPQSSDQVGRPVKILESFDLLKVITLQWGYGTWCGVIKAMDVSVS